jgi:hypothetical protein
MATSGIALRLDGAGFNFPHPGDGSAKTKKLLGFFPELPPASTWRPLDGAAAQWELSKADMERLVTSCEQTDGGPGCRRPAR